MPNAVSRQLRLSDPYADEVSAEDERVMRAMVDISCRLGVERIVISDRPAVPRQGDLHDTDGRNVQFGIDIDSTNLIRPVL